jgi:hypothetical protein
MTKQELIHCIMAELDRQSKEDGFDAPYLYNETITEEKVETGIDGNLNISRLADAILNYVPPALGTNTKIGCSKCGVTFNTLTEMLSHESTCER